MKKLFRYFLPYYRTYKKEIVLALSGMIAVSIGTVGSAHMLKPILDDVFIHKDRAMLWWVVIAIVGVFALKATGRFLQSYYSAYIGNDIVRRLRNRLARHLMYQDIAFLHSMRNGELLSRTTNDIMRLQLVATSLLPQLLVNLLLIIALSGYVIYQSPKLALYFLVIMFLAFLPLKRLAKRMKKYSHHSQQSAADMTARLSEIFATIEMVKADSSQSYEYLRFNKDNAAFFKHSMKQVKVNTSVGPVMEFFGSVAVAVAIFVGANEVIDGDMSAGSFFAFVAALFMLYDPIKKLSQAYNQAQDASAAIDRIEELFATTPTVRSGDKILKHIRNICFEKVSLRYNDTVALKGISFEARRGNVYALVGDSGAGKSSTVNLLVRFYDPTSGRILLNGEDIRSFTLESLHERIAYVTQRIVIFHDTVARNVAYAKEPDEARVIEALKKAHAWEFVSKMPKGIDTMLDESGSNLSGGQRQRIALARALYKNPDVLILDEATSALDNKSEAAIQQALEGIRGEMITFVVAHRLSTIEEADEIWVFDSGKIIDKGKYKELLDRSEAFRKLARQNR